MGLKIYKEISNNNADKNDNNILLEFVCNVKLYDACDIFSSCLHWDEDDGEYTNISEAWVGILKHSIDYLGDTISRRRNNTCVNTTNEWFEEANRCYDILFRKVNTNNEAGDYYIIFVT